MKDDQASLVPGKMLLAFALVVVCFPFWGFGENVTNPLVHAFSRILLISHFESSLIQFAFYGGYFAMAVPAAIFVKRHSYKAGILLGLALYAAGALLFIPASMQTAFWPFLAGYFVLTCGLSFLETSANPYVLTLGPEETATRRLNLAQSFGPIGSLVGMLAAKKLILEKLSPATAAERTAMDPSALQALTTSDLQFVRDPYIYIAVAIAVLFVVIYLVKLPRRQDTEAGGDLRATAGRLIRHRRYREGVIAQFFYVGAQIMVWTFIIHYATMELGFTEARAQDYNMLAMVIFVLARFICTFFLRYIAPARLLLILAAGGLALTLGTMFLRGMPGLYALIGISACMSLMFPTIYGLALGGVGDDAKIGAAGLIMAILGGSVLPPLMGSIVDHGDTAFLSAVRLSFVLPLLCFVVIAVYGYRAFRVYQHERYIAA